uniref:U5 small nuclear ribonucleoprotein TSSC4 n=1 Tax=Anthurium amnicola TaxID=1678845 RepID=A0A1D1YT84_9ARAE
MDDSFKVRVERLFGSRLFESVPTSSFPDSSWSVTDDEVERKEWNRERGGAFPDRDEMPCASDFDECFAKTAGRSGVSKKRRLEDDIDDLDDGDEGAEEDGDDAEEEREVRSSIGLDPTLDYEEEEDEFDRAAFGREDASERVYMRDVKDHGPFMNYHTIIEDSSEEVHFDRDPRADHLAANARLKEDKDVGGSLQFDSTPNDVVPKIKITESDMNLKPILKRKGNQVDSRPKKHVRFGPGCKDHCSEQLSDFQDLSTVPNLTESAISVESRSLPPEESPNVPDYIRNPSKYVRYSFDPNDGIDDTSNRRAFDDFWRMVRTSKSEPVQPDDITEPPKSVIFTPRKRASEAVPTDDSWQDGREDTCKEPLKESLHAAIRSVGIAVAEAPESETCAMEEDSMDISVEKAVGSQRSYRQYRPRTHTDDSAC